LWGKGFEDYIIIYLCNIFGEGICGKGFEEYILMRFVGGGGRKRVEKEKKLKTWKYNLEKGILIELN